MKLCLIGSSRFLESYAELNRSLSLAGHVVYSIATCSSSAIDVESEILTTTEKEILDLVHLRKIQESEGVVLVTNEEGYIGPSTTREIRWAQMNNIPIFGTPQDIENLYKGLIDPDPAKSIRRTLRDAKRYREEELRRRDEESEE